MRCVGTVVRGIRTGIIKENDNLANIVVDSLIKASENDNFTFKDRDIVAITEAVVGISSGNYATIDDIVEDLSKKISKKNIGIVFPILSRNRFALILKAIARYADSITMLLSYPADEVGNGIMEAEALSSYRDNNKNEVISEDEYGNEVRLQATILEDEDYILSLLNKEEYDNVRKIIETLKERERIIIELYFGINNNKTYKQKEIASMFNCNQSYVSRLVKRTLKKIKKELIEKDLIELNNRTLAKRVEK